MEFWDGCKVVFIDLCHMVAKMLPYFKKEKCVCVHVRFSAVLQYTKTEKDNYVKQQ